MEISDSLLISELRRDEGVRYSPYKDSMGILTVGVGHNLAVKPIHIGWTYPLTDAQVNQLLAEDLAEVFAELDDHLPWWRNLSYARQRVVANMTFNLGMEKLLTFKNTVAAIQKGQWQNAATGMLLSKWAKQVGARANRLADMMLRG